MARKYLKEFGEQIADNGYEVIPIRPGEKRPYGEGWQKYLGTAEGVREWIEDGKGHYGVGIKCKNSPAIDIDVHDETVVAEIEEMITAKLGPTLARVGKPPKKLLAFRTNEPFAKVDSGFWVDGQGRTVKVEILGDGQQYVAAHIHPDTGKPYQWLGKSVLNTKREDLPELTLEVAQEIKDEAIRIFLGHGWVKKSNAIASLSSTYDPDDPFAAVKPKTEISDDKLFEMLMRVPGPEDYDLWAQIGMALYHQYDGSQEGLDLWHQWSAQAHNYDENALNDKWPTFDISGKSRQPITARIIIKLARQQDEEINKKKLAEVEEGLIACKTLEQLKDVCQVIKTTDFDGLVREMLVARVKERFKRITGSMPRIGTVRDMTRYESPEQARMPGWLKNWVYIQHDESFFNMADRRFISRTAFAASYNRLMMTGADRAEGKSVPEITADNAALNLYEIPTVYNRMFMPGVGQLYRFGGLDYVNSYTDQNVPEIPEKYSPADWQAVQTILDHFTHLLANERDRRIFMDWLAFIVQNPGKRINWAILLQGAEGDGKSFFSNLLKVMVGLENVNVIQGSALEEKYNPWAEGALVCFVEDVRLHGANRFDAVNKLKPMITNATVSIRRMNTDVYEVVNTMNYITTSNMKDALPVGEEDSRFFPIFTRFQTQAAIRAFKKANPDYYRRLHAALTMGGALRKYFLEHELSAEFDPADRAPESSNRREMVELNRRDDEIALFDALEESDRPDFSTLLLDSDHIYEEFMDRDVAMPNTQGIKRLLSTCGFTYLDRVSIDGKKRRYWTQRPDIWSSDPDIRREQIRSHVDPEGL